MNPERRLRIVLATVGSRGDVQSMLALLVRGHVPMVAAPPNFESWVRSLDFDFVAMGADIRASDGRGKIVQRIEAMVAA
jgi:vancomycin aglycone glucosyltransferase